MLLDVLSALIWEGLETGNMESSVRSARDVRILC